MIENKKYFVDQVNSSKAYQFMCMYHYSHVGFKKSKLNLGIFKKDTKQLVGVLQLGCAASAGIRLDRYVKEPIKIEEYMELNRFAMADSEERNSESMAISLGLKWIKQNRPDIKLIVSYSGRVEGNYGYIYQATNWEYLGYFLSPGFWKIDGKEFHHITLSLRYTRSKGNFKNMNDFLCQTYHDVRQYTSKQFIYIQRLDKKLTPASPILPYPKPTTDYPIQTREKVYKKDDEYVAQHSDFNIEIKEFYYDPEEPLFSKQCLVRNGMHVDVYRYCMYSKEGKLEEVSDSITELSKKYPEYQPPGISISANKLNRHKDKYFRKYTQDQEIPDTIPVDIICYIDGIPFYKQKEIVAYTGASRQTVSVGIKRKSKKIGGKEVCWDLEE